jgi:hypothetical protein|tara:strand:- start:1882 stop:2085 length:204 start_codon:yes stop_codon:yes gene_type:complete
MSKVYNQPPMRDGDFFNQVGLGGGSRTFKSKAPSRKEVEKRDKKNSEEAKKRKKKKNKVKTRKRYPK